MSDMSLYIHVLEYSGQLITVCTIHVFVLHLL